MSMPTDAELIANSITNDDKQAFGELVRRYQSKVRSLLMRCTRGDHCCVDELAQRTFVKAYLSLPKYRGTSQFGTWLYRIAYNEFLGSGRRDKYTEFRPDMDELATTDRHDRRALANHEIEKLTNGLSDPVRMALHLFYGEQLSHKEIADVLSCPVGSVKTNITRGREAVRLRLSALKARETA
jgi:RNA polymerase sigma-70 factor (ECF subfamily)